MNGKVKLAIGQTWRCRNGDVVTIVERNEGSAYPWGTQPWSWYSGTGAFRIGVDSPMDLVELIPGDGWIVWRGGDKPVPQGTLVDVVHRNGNLHSGVRAGELGRARVWSHSPHHDDDDDDIMAYRISNSEAEKVAGALSVQVGGSHYKDMAIQPVEFIHKNKIGFIPGNVIKYVCRADKKGGVEDLKKARHYIDLLIEMNGGEA